MKRLFLSILLAVPMMALASSVQSPNGNIELKFSVDNTGRPVYEMTYKGKAVINPSHLGLVLAKDKHASLGMNEKDLMNGFTIKDEQTTTFDETWKPVWGETATIRNHYNELAVTLEQRWLQQMPKNDRIQKAPRQLSRTILIRFRVYDDGID